MNAHTQTLDAAMAQAVDTELSKMLRPEEQAERLAAGHRSMGAKSQQRAADTRKALKAKLAGYEADRRSLKARYDEDMALLSQFIAETKEQAERDINADKRILASSKAALDALGG